MATVYATGTTDRLHASATLVRLLADVAVIDLDGFDRVRAHAQSSGRNTAEVAALDYVLELFGVWDA